MPAKKRAPVTPTLSAALIEMVTVPLTVAPSAGEVMLTVGATTSGGVAPRSMRPYRPPAPEAMPAAKYSVVLG